MLWFDVKNGLQPGEKMWKTWVAGGKNEGPSAGKELMQRDLTTTCIAIGCGENRWRQCHLPSSKESSLIARVIHGWQVCTSLTNKADKIEKADVGIFWNPLSTLSIDWKFGATAPVDVLLWNAVEGQELLYTLIIIDHHWSSLIKTYQTNGQTWQIISPRNAGDLLWRNRLNVCCQVFGHKVGDHWHSNLRISQSHQSQCRCLDLTAPKLHQKHAKNDQQLRFEIDGPVDTIIACQIDYVVRQPGNPKMYWNDFEMPRNFQNCRGLLSNFFEHFHHVIRAPQPLLLARWSEGHRLIPVHGNHQESPIGYL